MKRPYITLDAKTLPENQMVAFMGDSLILHDNFEKDIKWDGKETSDFINNPIKLSSTMMIFFCLEGEVSLVSNMQQYHMKKNDVIFMKSGLFAEVTHISHDISFVLIAMDEKFYFPIFNGFVMSELQKDMITSPICHLSDFCINECISLYKLLKERLKSHMDDLLQGEIAKGYLQSIAFIVYSQYIKALHPEKIQPLNVSRQQDLFNRFMELLQENYTHERNINFYAGKLCVTPRYLSRVIRDISGNFAGEHIDLFVIAEAKQLLRSKEYTILQISEMLNFTSQSLFGRYFKKFTGYAPKEYQSIK